MSSKQKNTNGQPQQMIAEAACFRAERRSFKGGDAVRDWCEAEAEMDARLRRLTDGRPLAAPQRLKGLPDTYSFGL